MNAAASALQHFVLPNGLRVQIEARPQVESITALLVVRAGSRYETSANNGISHFVEHMVFDGTDKWLTEEAVTDVITHHGGFWNGWTSDETTSYYVQLEHSQAELALDWLSQVVFHPTFPADKVDKERGIIFQEKMGRYGRWVNALNALGLGYDLDRQIRRAMFPDSTLSLRTIGEDASLDRITRESLLDYYRAHYTPANSALIITGHVDADHLNGLVRRYFGAVTGTPSTPPAPSTPAQPKRGPQTVTVRGPLATDESVLIVGMRTSELTHPDRWPLLVLAEIMEEALLKAIRIQRGLAYSVSAFSDHFMDTGYFGLVTQFETQHRGQIQKLIEEFYQQVRHGQLKVEQVINAQTALTGGHVLAMEDNLRRAEWLAQWAFASTDWSVPDYALAIQAVTLADVQRVAETYFTAQRRYVGLHQPFTTVPQTVQVIGGAIGWMIAAQLIRQVWRKYRGQRS